MRRAVLAFLVLAGVPSNGSAAFYLDPSLKFETIETSHFRIHFHQGGIETAGRIASMAEEIHEALVPLMGWTPESKTHVLLLDIGDAANGMATPFPYNAVVIFASQPGPEDSISFYDDWIRMVFVHEYTHILHLDHAGGLPRALRYIFGRLYFPNMFQPLWLIEGIAAYQESAFTGAGRGKGSLFDMMIRTAFLEGKLNSIDQGDGPLALWPGGHFPYLYGVMFYQYLADRYGKDGVLKILRHSSALPLPFFLNSAPKKAVGKSYSSLWLEWEASLKEKYEKQLEAVKASPLTDARRLTFRGYQIRGPVFSPDGETILYSESGPVEYPSLRLIGRDGKGDRPLYDRNDGMFSSWSRDGKKIVFSQPETYHSFSLFNDLYILEDGRVTRLSTGMRLGYPDISPDGSRIACIREHMGKTELGIFLPDTKSFAPILNGEDGTRYSSPRWSPDGLRMAVSAFRPGGYREILLLDVSTGSFFTAAGSPHWNLFPSWSPDGAYIVYSSDRSGISNLYAYSLESGETTQVTNMITGAFESSVSPDGKEIAFTGYSADGFDIYLTEFAPQKERPAGPLAGAFTPSSVPSAGASVEARPYSPIQTVLPRFWIPYVDYSSQSGTSVMALTFGADILLRHIYGAAGLYRTQVNRGGGYLLYRNDVLYPSIIAEALVDPNPSYTYTDPSGKAVIQWETEAGGSVDVSFPLLFFRSSHAVSVGYGYRSITPITPLPAYLISRPEDGIFAGLTLGYKYTNALRFPLSISRENGRTFSVSYEILSPALGSNFETQRLMGDYREYVSLHLSRPRHVLGLRLAGGTGWGDTLNRRAFHMGGFGREETLLEMIGMNSGRDLYLRGYPTGFFRGQRAFLFSSEYRFPLSILQRGCWTWPFFLGNMSLSAFFDFGYAWDRDNVSIKDFRKGVGVEFKMDTTIVYEFPLTFTLGHAIGTDRDGITEDYLTIGSAF